MMSWYAAQLYSAISNKNFLRPTQSILPVWVCSGRIISLHCDLLVKVIGNAHLTVVIVALFRIAWGTGIVSAYCLAQCPCNLFSSRLIHQGDSSPKRSFWTTYICIAIITLCTVTCRSKAKTYEGRSG
jgi:dipeptide/tripeptide permease